MNTRIALSAAALLLVCACSRPTSTPTPTPASTPIAATPIPSYVGAEEYAVYRSVLVDNTAMWNIPTDAKSVVFFDHTVLRHDPENVRAILAAEAGVSDELVASFLEANRQSYPLEAEFELGQPAVLVSEEEIRNLVRGLDYAEQCSETIRTLYPFPQHAGWYALSRVGFDADMTQALVYFEQSLCGGSGDFLMLEKEAGVWKIMAAQVGLQTDLRLDSPYEIGGEEYKVYNAVVAASKAFSLGTGYEAITIYDRTGLWDGLIQQREELYAAIQPELPTLTQELVDSLIGANAESYDVALRFDFEAPVVLVSWLEYSRLSQEHEEPECLRIVRERFPSPRFQGWFRLSRVGFSPSMDQALVYVESYVCNGAGFLVLLERRGDLWQVTDYSLVWLS